MDRDTLMRAAAGEPVELSVAALSLRDASAARLASAIDRGEPLPVPLAGRIMYAVGPSPAPPGRVIGSAGPTTTARIARFLPALFSAGVIAVIGKGELHDDMAAFTKHGAIYLAAIGGLGALLSKHIIAAEVVGYEDLGAEALYALELERFPAVVIIDRAGRNFNEEARASWRKGAVIAAPRRRRAYDLAAITACACGDDLARGMRGDRKHLSGRHGRRRDYGDRGDRADRIPDRKDQKLNLPPKGGSHRMIPAPDPGPRIPHPGQSGVGCSAASMTTTGIGPVCFSSLSPSCC
jgi:fumarate hydratase subunit beta